MLRFVFICAAVVVTCNGWGWFDTKKETTETITTPMDISLETDEAFDRLNLLREAVGLNTLERNEILDRAAEAHARYILLNQEPSHYESESKQGFTGKTPRERALAAGYASLFVQENFSTNAEDAQHSVTSLMSAVYHRFTFLNMKSDIVGIGIAEGKGKKVRSAFVYLLGNAAYERLCRKDFDTSQAGDYLYGVCRDTQHYIPEKRYRSASEDLLRFNPKIALYPYDGEKEVSPVFYEEDPDPLPDYEVSGFPVTVSFNPYYFKKVTLERFELYDTTRRRQIQRTRLIEATTDPNGIFTPLQFALMPLRRLEYDTEYEVVIVFRDEKGKRLQKRWRFHTYAPEGELIRIEKRIRRVRLKKGTTYTLYFVPLDEHETIKDVRYPNGIELHFVDHNTLSLYIPRDYDGDITIESDKRKVIVETE